MKKTLFAIAVLLTTVSLSAQYKKASFFNKEGRTYSLSTIFQMMGGGRGTPIGIDLTFGTDKENNLFSFSELVLIPSYGFSYKTTAKPYNDNLPTQDVTIKSKTRFSMGFWSGLGYYFMKDADKNKIQSYASLALGGLFVGNAKDDKNYDTGAGYDLPEKLPNEDPTFVIGFRGGLGGIYNLSSSIGIKADIGYSYSFLKKSPESVYAPYKNHPYLSLGVRFKIDE